VVLDSWYGIMAAAGTPRAVLEKCRVSVTAVTKEPEFVAALARQGAVPFASNPDESAKIMADELKLWTRVIQKAKIQMD